MVYKSDTEELGIINYKTGSVISNLRHYITKGVEKVSKVLDKPKSHIGSNARIDSDIQVTFK